MTNVQICPQCSIAATGAETEPKCRCCGTLLRRTEIMGSSVALTHKDGQLSDIVMHDAGAATVTDCHSRSDGKPFVRIDVFDGRVRFNGYLKPETAESLTRELLKLFPQAAEPTFDPLVECENIVHHLTVACGGLTSAQHLAFAVLRQACQEVAEHNALT